jgi:hypothetical protein
MKRKKLSKLEELCRFHASALTIETVRGSKPLRSDYFTQWQQSKQLWLVQLKFQDRSLSCDFWADCQPKIVDVISALLVDEVALDMTFKEWCSEFLYSPTSLDSRSTFIRTRRLGRKLRKLLGDKFSLFVKAGNES